MDYFPKFLEALAVSCPKDQKNQEDASQNEII